MSFYAIIILYEESKIGVVIMEDNRVEVKDMFSHRQGRMESQVIKTWEKYKDDVFFSNIILCHQHNAEHLPNGMLNQVRQDWQGAEIAVDTFVGWLNSPVGRSFVSEAFGVDIPRYPSDGSE